MKIRLRLISAVSAALVLCSAFAATAYAEEYYEEQSSDYAGESSSYVEPDPDTGEEDPGYDVSSDTGSDSSSSYYEDPASDTYSDISSDVPQESSDVQSEYNSGENAGSSEYQGEHTPDYNSYGSDNSSESFYVGGGQTYVEPDSTAPSASLYDVEENVDTNELKSSDWDDIASALKNASAADSDSGDDFSFIQNNNSSSDNGGWMLFAGIACLVLGAAGIVYFIVSSLRSRKRAKSARRSGAAVPARSTANSQARRSKFDTADVRLPKSTRGGSGKRYR